MTQLRIASNLSHLRKLHKLTQEAMAEQLGISFQAISKWENGQAYPDIMMLPHLSKMFHYSIDELLLHDVSQSFTKIINQQDANEYTSMEGGKYSIKLFHDGKEAASFTELDQQINIRLEGHVNHIESAFSISCDHIEGDAKADGSVSCQSIQGEVRAGGHLNCITINGNAAAGGNLTCERIEGNATAGNSIECGILHGDAFAGYQVTRKS